MSGKVRSTRAAKDAMACGRGALLMMMIMLMIVTMTMIALVLGSYLLGLHSLNPKPLNH